MLLKNMKLLCAAVFAAGAVALNAAVPAMVLEYDYNDNGSISSRTINGAVQKFEYDKRGQLLSVKDKSGNFVERYAYDKAGNILEKEINGKVTKFTYDKANQLVSKTAPDGKVTNYSYDAAGRLVKEGDKEYKYSYLDKLVEVTENGKPVANFDYYVDGQIATATQNGVTENFVWDGLALVARNTTSYVNEPAVTGGNPILANNKVLFNDMLGSTLGVKDGSKMTQVAMTSFGETSNNDAFFTGKPMIGELGYAFLFRNYRADNGKWQTADPMGYPDGWNNLAYCNNGVTDSIDWRGGEIKEITEYMTMTTRVWDGDWSAWYQTSTPNELARYRDYHLVDEIYRTTIVVDTSWFSTWSSTISAGLLTTAGAILGSFGGPAGAGAAASGGYLLSELLDATFNTSVGRWDTVVSINYTLISSTPVSGSSQRVYEYKPVGE